MRTLSAVVTPRNKLASDDKRSKTDLELFLLVLVSKEIDTPYQLLTAARLSVGATVPALRRLEKAGHVRRGKPGTRGRADYLLTKEGMRRLKSGWRPLLEASIPADVEAILRTAALALLSGADRKIIARYLKRAAASKTADSKRR